MEEDIPIDIHIPKLLDWLISRHHCKKSWQTEVLPIREKINSAIQDMPEHREIAQLLTGTYINYDSCIKIVEILKETEADTKNLIGRYGSQRMKDWQEIVRLYQRDNIYLAEAGSIVLRNVKYEIPNLKKQISKLLQIQTECEKKIVEYGKNIVSAQKDALQMKKNLGIEGNNIAKELLKQTLKLKNINDEIATQLRTLQTPVNYYKEFISYLGLTLQPVPLITFIMEHRDATVYRWLYGKEPESIEDNRVSISSEPENEESVVDEIDWDIDVVEGDKEIDYGITVEEEETVEISSDKNTIAKGQEVFSVLDNSETREQFITELLELKSFFTMRLSEVDVEDDNFILPDKLHETSEDIKRMISSIDNIDGMINDPVTEQLHFIKHTPRYIDKVVALFKQKTNTVEKLEASREAVEKKLEEAKLNEESLRPMLKNMVAKTRELQSFIEKDISKRYKNRPVHLIGGI